MKIVRNLIISITAPENKNDGWLKPDDSIEGTFKLYIFSNDGWEPVISGIEHSVIEYKFIEEIPDINIEN